MHQETPETFVCSDWRHESYRVLSIREYTAIQVIHALLTRTSMPPKIIAKQAVMITDALIEELEKSKN